MLNRSVKKIHPIDNSAESNNSPTFGDILKIPNIVLLGEPGAGKTYLFENASQHEQGKYIAARIFTVYADESYYDKPLYIDALDEKRSRTDQSDSSIAEIIRCIKQVKPSKVRISCRAADWLGETDLELFRPYFEANGGYCVVALEALTEKEIDQILRGKDIAEPSGFREKAYEKGVSTLLTNPQTLIMLADLVIKDGQWPNSKKELYENATRLLLTEHNDKHKRKPLAGYKFDALKDASGAACAILLIADVGGISLLESSSHSYADIPYSDSGAVLAALTKRAFVIVNQQQEYVNYSHRTIAEYLAACWLAKSIRDGRLPISRVRCWLGIDNYPAPELRGLYAWLVQLLPECADALLTSDPYGVLVLGDVSCLSRPSRKTLLNALVQLSEKDPWFRAQDWTSEPLGALSTPDMANEFKAILSRQPRQFHLRSIVLNAIIYGEQQPDLKDELLQIFRDNDALYAERSGALGGLINAIPDGKHLVVETIKELQASDNNLRLKAEAMAWIYEGHFNVEDIVRLISDCIDHRDFQNYSISQLWGLSHSLPLAELPALLDRLTQVDSDKFTENYQVGHFVYEILKRTLFDAAEIDVNRLWLWLSKLKYGSGYGINNKDEIKDWLNANQPHVIALFNVALHDLSDFTSIWEFWYGFQEAVRCAPDTEQIVSEAFSLIAENGYCNEKEQFIFELALNLTVNKTKNLALFNLLLDYGSSHPELADILSCSCCTEIPDWRWKHINKAFERKKKQRDIQQKNRREFEEQQDLIRTGQHFGWLEWLADVYFARSSSVDRKQSPKKRLEQELGEQSAEVALQGLRVVLNRNDLPTPLEIVNLHGQNQYQRWWYSILAGMSECWREQDDLTAYSEQALKAALAINLLFPVYYRMEGDMRRQTEPDWQQLLFQHKPALVQSVYLEVIEVELKMKSSYVHGINEICRHSQLSNNRAVIILRLLTDYPNAMPDVLESLLLTAITLPEIKEDLLSLAQSALKPLARIRLKQKALWLCVGFLIDFDRFKEAIAQCATKREHVIWILISIVDHVCSDNGSKQPYKLSTAQIDFIIRLIGQRFPNVEHPTGIMHGTQNPWDASDFIKKRINQLSARIDQESINALNRLTDERGLDSYWDYLKHASVNQAALRRKQLFVQLSWQQAIDVLSNRKPANIADLHALTVEHLKGVASSIRTENTDIFKGFWNEDSHGKITKPKSEESCRDRLIDLLRPKFTPLEISVEPEVHMVLDKRADIVLLDSARQKLPIEIKRDYHSDMWTACENQLDRLYTRDPQAQGYGIYLVFWFGNDRPQSMRRPPKPLSQPSNAQELENALRALIKSTDQDRLAVVVVDVTRPDD
jgi:hypothetical protein